MVLQGREKRLQQVKVLCREKEEHANGIVESVADGTRRPLYTVTSGDLGTDIDEVEKRLSTALELATTWNAVVLIDEADVFLEERRNDNLQRNGLVSG